jgi:hypothetical protein
MTRDYNDRSDYTEDEKEECLSDWGEQYRQTMIDVIEYRRRLKTLKLNASEIEEEVQRNSQ